MRVKISFWISVFIPFGYIPRSGTGGSYTSPIFFFFGGFSILFSIVTVPVNNVYFLNSRCSLSLSLSHTHTHTHTYIHTQRAVSDSLWPHGLYSPSASSIHGIRQARVLEWVATPFSRGSFWHRDRTLVTGTAGRFFTFEPSRKPIYNTHTHIYICVCVHIKIHTDAEVAGKWNIPEVSLSKRTTTKKTSKLDYIVEIHSLSFFHYCLSLW